MYTFYIIGSFHFVVIFVRITKPIEWYSFILSDCMALSSICIQWFDPWHRITVDINFGYCSSSFPNKMPQGAKMGLFFSVFVWELFLVSNFDNFLWLDVLRPFRSMSVDFLYGLWFPRWTQPKGATKDQATKVYLS